MKVSLVFADVRGSTSLAEKMSPTEFADCLNRFYREASRALIAHDGLIDKFVGDEVIALFVRGYAGDSFSSKAIAAALEVLKVTGHGDAAGPWLPVGVGVHTGIAFVGVVGAEGQVTDISALGDAVNVAARLSSEADSGEVLVSEEAARDAGLDTSHWEVRDLRVKGRDSPLRVHVVSIEARLRI